VLLTGTGLAFATNPPSPRPGTLRGHIAPSGHAKLRIHYRHAHHERIRWYTWHFYRVPLKCKSGPAVSRLTVKGGEGALNRYADRDPFGGASVALNNRHRVLYGEHVTGKLIDQTEAHGLLRVSGAKVPLRGGGHDKCDSGHLHWKVSR
jgi:hypothetical protein